MSDNILQPKEPLKLAIIGAGQRMRMMYLPLFSSLKPWIKIVAVCDPVKNHTDVLADQLNVPAYYDIRQLVKDRPMEAALVVTPIESHHSISVYLSSHKIHNLTETPWCSMLAQAEDMVNTAKRNDVTVRVAENFFRFPIDRFAQVLKENGYLGNIGRIFCYNDHTGYHNNSRWIRFAGTHPLWVQSVQHTMNTGAFYSKPQRFHQDETFRANFFAFPEDFMVIDQAANIKGFLGRQTRPGYTEWHGEYGTLVSQGVTSTTAPATYYKDGSITTADPVPLKTTSELRFCSPQSFEQYKSSPDVISEVVNEYEGHHWIRTYADTPKGIIEYRNPFRSAQPSKHRLKEYGACIMGHIVDFTLAVRGLAESEFDEQDALMSMMMSIGAQESALRDGERIQLPLTGGLESEQIIRKRIQDKYGIDPLDVEGMLGISYPKP